MNDKIQSRDVLMSGKTSFKIEVPYLLIETGEKNIEKPLIIYLHGYGENLKKSRKVFSEFMDISAYHLFIEGPYPIIERQGDKKVEDWGRSWYLFDGRQGQFIKSMELASEFIQEIVDRLAELITFNKTCMIGYSMGGYLAGYFALTRTRHVKDLVVIGCRIKTEVLDPEQTDWEQYQHLRVLAVHGKNDSVVQAEPQMKEIEFLKSKNINASIYITDSNHKMSKTNLGKIKNWLIQNGY
jgi:predicted esterase